MEKRLSVGNIRYKKKYIHRFTLDSGDSKSLLDFIIVHEFGRNNLFNVNVYRGSIKGISYQYLEVAKIRCMNDGV